MDILIQLSANSSGLSSNVNWTNNGATWNTKGKFSSNYAIDLNADKYMTSNVGIILPYNEKWFIYLWNYKSSRTNYDTIIGGTNSYYYSLQNKDAEFSNKAGMRIYANGYSISSTNEQPLNEWVHYYIDCDGNGNISFYLNGNLQQSITKNQNIDFSSFNLGSWGEGKFKDGTPGLIDDLVIAKGEQLFISNFNIPEVKFDNLMNINQSIILSYADKGIINNLDLYTTNDYSNAFVTPSKFITNNAIDEDSNLIPYYADMVKKL